MKKLITVVALVMSFTMSAQTKQQVLKDCKPKVDANVSEYLARVQKVQNIVSLVLQENYLRDTYNDYVVDYTVKFGSTPAYAQTDAEVIDLIKYNTSIHAESIKLRTQAGCFYSAAKISKTK